MIDFLKENDRSYFLASKIVPFQGLLKHWEYTTSVYGTHGLQEVICCIASKQSHLMVCSHFTNFHMWHTQHKCRNLLQFSSVILMLNKTHSKHCTVTEYLNQTLLSIKHPQSTPFDQHGVFLLLCDFIQTAECLGVWGSLFNAVNCCLCTNNIKILITLLNDSQYNPPPLVQKKKRKENERVLIYSHVP